MNQFGFWIWVWGLEHGYGYGVQVWVDGSQYEGYCKMIKQTVKTLFISSMVESIRESRETWKQHEFFISAMQNSKSRFLHGSNGLLNKVNEKSSRGLLSCMNTGETDCQNVWGLN